MGVPGYQFDDGDVKLEKNPPGLTGGTSAFYALCPLVFITFCATSCCAVAACVSKFKKTKAETVISACGAEAGHVESMSQSQLAQSQILSDGARSTAELVE